SFKMVAQSGASPEDRARAYVFSQGFPESIAGQRGHGPLYRCACELVDGFGLARSQALPILQEWNRTKAQPPECDNQIQHKLNDGLKNHPVPSLKRLNTNQPGVAHRPAPSGSRRNTSSASPGTFTLATTRASQVRPEPVYFLDGGVIPRGKLITLAGL